MKITLEFMDVTADEADQLKDAFYGLAPNELRKIRREFEVGDIVVDIYGGTMEIIRIECCGLYDMDRMDGSQAWRGVAESHIDYFKDHR